MTVGMSITTKKVFGSIMLFCKHCNKMVTVTRSEGEDNFLCSECGENIPIRSDLTPGIEVNGYRIERELGRGNMGVVYLATQINLDRQVALKVLSDRHASDESFVQRFFQEARSAACLSHPNIVQAYDAGVTADGIYYFVMELIDGENLDQVVAQSGALGLETALMIGEKIALAMEYAWNEKNMIHGDIKPENIIRKKNGEIKLADLGLARSRKAGSHSDEDIMATPAYAPPEVAESRNDSISFKSDMYSFGATMYHLIAGRPPFTEDNPEVVLQHQINDPVPPITKSVQKLPPQLAGLIHQLLEKDIDKRPANWAAVARTLKQLHSLVLRNQAVVKKASSHHTGPAAPVPPPRKKSNIPVVMFILSTVAILIAVGVIVSRGNAQKAAKQKTTQSTVVKNKAYYTDLWLKTKDEIMMLSDRSVIIQRIQAFEKEAGIMVPDDVHVTLKEQTEKFEQEQHYKKVKADAKKMLEHAKDTGRIWELDPKDLSAERQALAELIPQIEKYRKVLSQKDLSILKDYLKRLTFQENASSGSKKKKTEQSEVVEQNAAEIVGDNKQEAEEERLDREEKQRLAKAVKEENQQKAAKELDNLKKQICRLHFSKSSMNEFIKKLEQWKKEYSKTAAEKDIETCKNLIAFFSDAAKPIRFLLKKYQNTLKGRHLFPETRPGNVYEGCDERGIKLSTNDGGARIVRKVPWQEFSRKEKRNFVEGQLIGVFLKKFSKDEQRYLFCHAMTVGITPDDIVPEYSRNSKLSQDELSELADLGKLFIQPSKPKPVRKAAPKAAPKNAAKLSKHVQKAAPAKSSSSDDDDDDDDDD